MCCRRLEKVLAVVRSQRLESRLWEVQRGEEFCPVNTLNLVQNCLPS